MAEDNTGLDLDLEELDKNMEQTNKVEQRIKDLSNKVKVTSTERDELKALVEERDTQVSDLTAERDFLSSFTDATAKFPGATEHKDAILEKVKAGYSVEDATLVIMEANKPEEEAETKPESPAGGSATTSPDSGGAKTADDMTQEEKIAELKDLEARGELKA